MTDVAAVVAAANGSRGIGFQGNLVSKNNIRHKMVHESVFCKWWCTLSIL